MVRRTAPRHANDPRQHPEPVSGQHQVRGLAARSVADPTAIPDICSARTGPSLRPSPVIAARHSFRAVDRGPTLLSFGRGLPPIHPRPTASAIRCATSARSPVGARRQSAAAERFNRRSRLGRGASSSDSTAWTRSAQPTYTTEGPLARATRARAAGMAAAASLSRSSSALPAATACRRPRPDPAAWYYPDIACGNRFETARGRCRRDSAREAMLGMELQTGGRASTSSSSTPSLSRCGQWALRR